MAEEKKTFHHNDLDLPSHSGSEKRDYRKDSIDDDTAEVMFNSSLDVPPGKVVTESYKERDDYTK
jgi:hypothetical protein